MSKRVLRTPLCDMLGIDYPILSAGMGPSDYIGGLAGQISGIINEAKPAARVLEEMVEETVEIFARKLPETVVAK